MLMRSFLCLTLLTVVFGAGIVLDINNGTAGSRPDYLCLYNGSLFFSAAHDGSTFNLWSTSGGNQLDTYPLPGAVYGAYPAFLTAFQQWLVMSADDGQGTQLWSFNPETWFTKYYMSQGNFNPGTLDGFLQYNGKLIFAANAVESDIPQSWTVLYSFDGSMVFQISLSTQPRFATNFLGSVYFSANGGPTVGQELYTWDEMNGESRVSDFNGAAGSFPSFLTVFADKLFFSMYSDAFGAELASFDGSAFLLEVDINPGLPGSNPADLTVYNNLLYFSAMSDSLTGVELWCYDGFSARLVADINPTGTGLSYPASFTVIWDLLLFSATDGTHGNELWAHNGNQTWMLADLNPGGADSNPANFIEFDDDIYFVAETADQGRELWISNGIIPNPNQPNNTDGNNTGNSTEPVCMSVNTECQLDGECCTGYCDLGGPMPAHPHPQPDHPKTPRPVVRNCTEEDDEDENETEIGGKYPGRREGKAPPPPKGGPTNNSTNSTPTDDNSTDNTTPPPKTPKTPYDNSTDDGDDDADNSTDTNTTTPKTPKSPMNTTIKTPRTDFNNSHEPKMPVPFSKGKAQGSKGTWSYRCMCRPEHMECSDSSQCCSGACVPWNGKATKMSRGSKGTKHTPHSKGSYSKGSKGSKGSMPSGGNMTNTTEGEEEVVWVCGGPPRSRASKNLGKSVGVGVGVGVGMGALITIGVLTRRSILKRRREASEAQTETATESVAMTEPTVPTFKFVPVHPDHRVDA